MSGSPPITILLAEDHNMVRQGLSRLLSAYPNFRVVAEAKNGREAVAKAQAVHPDVCIIDLAMPVLNGTEASRQIIKLLPDTHVIILTAYADDDYFERLRAIGVVGFLAKQTSLDYLARAITTVMQGSTWFSDSTGRHRRKLRDEPSGSVALPPVAKPA